MNKLTYGLMAVAAAGCVASCDTKLDVTDIDSTVRLDVKDLVLPINVDALQLKSVIEPEGNLTVENGQYVFSNDGTFSSSAISIPSYVMPAPVLNPTSDILTPSAVGTRDVSGAVTFNLSTTPVGFEFRSEDVPHYLVSIESIECPVELTATFSVPELAGVLTGATISNLQLQVLPGLTGIKCNGETPEYKAVEGIITLPDVRIGGDGKLTVTLTADGVNIPNAGINYDNDMGVMSYSASVGVLSGDLSISPSDLVAGATVPGQIHFNAEYKLKDIDVKSFTGKIEYPIENIVIPEIDLTDLPDFINQGGTNIWMENPQIYLSMNNPLQEWNVYARASFMISAYYQQGNNTPRKTYYMPSSFTIGQPANASGQYAFCMSPSVPATMPEAFAGAAHLPYPTLQQVLSYIPNIGGTGIPNYLKPVVYPCEIPSQRVEKFPLGRDFGAVSGEYRLVAPLAMVDNSAIVYNDTIDGWDSDDIKDLAVTHFELNMNVTTDIPVAVEMTGHLVDAQGKPMSTSGTSGEGDIKGAKIEANANNQAVNIVIDAPKEGFKGIGGIVIRVVATAKGTPAQALSPDMTVTLSNVRPKVSGYYEKTL